MTNIQQKIMSKKLWERLLSVWGISITLFLLVTAVSYVFLPQGILRGRIPSSGLLGQFVNPLEAFTKIFLFNLFMGGSVYAIICNFFEVDEVPLGYFAIWFSISIFGIIEGTNSFVYPYENIYASLRGFLRTGLWEFTAYILMTTATTNLVLYKQTSWTSWKICKIKNPSEIRIERYEKLAYFIGVVILAIAALTETLAIFGYVSW